MSPSGNRLTPASGRAPRTPRDRTTAGRTAPRSGVLAAVRWPRALSRPGGEPGSDDDGRWGVARLVAEREAERRGAVAVDDGPVPEARVGEAADPSGGGSTDEDAERPVDSATTDGEPAEDGARSVDAATTEAEPDAAGERSDPADGLTAAEPPSGEVPQTEDRPDTQDRPVAAEPGDRPGPPAPRTPEPAVPPSPRPPLRTPPVPRPPLPSPRRPPVVRTGPVVPNAADSRASRPRVDPDPSLFGFARHTRGRIGARLFTLFFVLVFALILVQTIASIV
jgi:hypothetical protein